MFGFTPRRWALTTLALSATLLSSCGSFQRNAQSSSERQPQANDPLGSTKGIAMTVFRSTAVSTVRQPVTTTKLGFSLAYQRTREMFRSNVSLADVLPPPPPEVPGTPEFEKLLDRSNIRRPEVGTLAFRVDGPAFFSDYHREVANAKKSIDVQVFIFDNDDTAVKCADALRARSGQVPVRVLFDDLGSTFAATAPPETPGPVGFTPPRDMADYLKENSKLRVRRTLNPWLIADHTKLLVFDKERAYLGGMNLGREYRSEWHDLMVRVEGPIVSSLEKEFTRAWRKAGPWGDLALFRNPIKHTPPPAGSGVPIRLLRTDPAEGKYEIVIATKLAIRSSRKRVWIENPYFAVDEVEDELIAAARRGVDVRVILPARGDSTIMDAGNLATARSLMTAGVKVLQYPRMTHMKVMVCDGWATLGSANLDMLSMRVNRELNVAFSDPATIKALENAVFLPDFRRSRRMTAEEVNTLLGPLAELVADQL